MSSRRPPSPEAAERGRSNFADSFPTEEDRRRFYSEISARGLERRRANRDRRDQAVALIAEALELLK